jgi:hypothetical protein
MGVLGFLMAMLAGHSRLTEVVGLYAVESNFFELRVSIFLRSVPYVIVISWYYI